MQTSGMICGFFLFVFLSIMELGVQSEIIQSKAGCGKTANITIPCEILTCNLSYKITNVTLMKVIALRGKKQLWTTNQQPFCSQDKKYCLKISKDGNHSLIVHSTSFEDEGTYELYIQQPTIQSNTIYLRVTGVCEPVLSSNGDELTCEVKGMSTNKPTITWMQNGAKNKMEQDWKNMTRNEVRSSIKLTEDTKKVQLCCSVSYEKDGKQQDKQTCTNHQDLPDPERVCEPVLSSSEDKLTCEVKMEGTHKPTITWMKNETKMEQYLKNVTRNEVRSSIKLTEETKKVQLCCSVSYEEDGIQQDKQICTDPQDLSDAEMVYKVKENTIVPVSLSILLVAVIGVALCTAYRQRRYRRERTFSGANLIGSEEENLEASVQLQSSQDHI